MSLARQLMDLSLEPSDLDRVTDGAATVRAATIHQTRDSAVAVLEFEPGEFEWVPEASQSLCIVEGCGTISFADDRRTRLVPGTSFYLLQDVPCRWIVENRVRCVCVTCRISG